MKRACVLCCVLVLLLTACGKNAALPQTQTQPLAVQSEQESAQPYTTQPQTLEQTLSEPAPQTESAPTRTESAKKAASSTAAAQQTRTTTMPTTAAAARESQTFFTVPAAGTTKPTERSTTAATTSTTKPTASTTGPTTSTTAEAAQTTGRAPASPVTGPTVTQTAARSTTKSPQTSSALKTCTVTINCTQLRDHPEKLKKPEKALFVPANGYIVQDVTVTLSGGETVYDVLREVCRTHTCTDNCRFCQGEGIQMESSYSPQFDSYYVEGIHQLYEKDCGGTSGWVYYVNGQFPNVGSSAYPANPGDRIEWIYSIEQNGLE
ncbi:MAG: DUF4430 domain-containing protein [Clostridia bacterium]|nr:DUF4430 domain-containing protein [Clostridia bacterium]